MPIDTNYTGPAPWLQHAATGENQPYVQSFLSAYQTAKHENSPLYKAQVAQAQKQVQRMGYVMAKDQLDIEKERNTLFDRIEGQKSLSELSATMAEVTDWSDPNAVADVDLVYSKRPTPEGKFLVTEAHTRHREAVAAKDRAEKNALYGMALEERTGALKERSNLLQEREERLKEKTETEKTLREKDQAIKDQRIELDKSESGRRMLEASMKDRTLQKLESDLSKAQDALDQMGTEAPFYTTKKRWDAKREEAMKAVENLQQKVEGRRSYLLNQINASKPGGSAPTAHASPTAERLIYRNGEMFPAE